MYAPLQSSFPSDDEYDAYVQRSLQGSPASGRGGAAPFADAFKRVSSALTEAAEEEQREQLRQQGSPADSGHLSLPSSRSRGSSRRSSPGGGGSQPASPLARMRHAVSGLTSRLMPSSLPQLLPSGAVDASGQELPVSGTGPARLGTLGARLPAGAARRASCSAAESSAAAGGLEQQGSGAAAGAVRPQRILVSGAGIDSPTSGMTGSAGSGAVLGRRAPALTPFSEMESLQWQQQEGAAAGSCTPQRLAGLPPWGAQAVVAQSQPATPSDMLLAPQPPATHRRAMTAGYSAASTASRRRRRVHLDLLQPLAGLRPIDLQRPAVAAALAIAANPSPRATISPGTGGARDGKGLRSSDGVAAAACASGGGLGAAGSPSGSVGSAEELVLPIRALQFDAEDGAAGQAGECGWRPFTCKQPIDARSWGGNCSNRSLFHSDVHCHFFIGGAGSGGVRRASTAPPAAWLAAALAGEASVESVEAELPVSSSALRPWGTSSDDGAPAADGGAGACGRPVDLQQQQSAAPAAIADTATPSGSTTASPSGLGAASLPGRPLSASPCGPGGSQSRRALLAVVSQLQEEVAVAESRRHEAERQAQEAADLAADLRRQLLKVQGLVASKVRPLLRWAHWRPAWVVAGMGGMLGHGTGAWCMRLFVCASQLGMAVCVRPGDAGGAHRRDV